MNAANDLDLATDARNRPGYPVRLAGLVAAAAALVIWASPPVALAGGVAFALLIGDPLANRKHWAAKWLLQICVVLLGFSMDLPVVLRLGLHGSVFAATTIAATLLLGWWMGRRFGLAGRTATLISVGTAICGGSAIAAVSSVIGASASEIGVSIGTVFLLNAVALYLFPVVGHWLHLSQSDFGLWAGIAIHDISSVVGAGISYGSGALQTATAVKLSRTLWIVPLTLAFSFSRRRGAKQAEDARPLRSDMRYAAPWFIGAFLLASLSRSALPWIAAHSPMLSEVARRGMILVLFLIGTSLSRSALRTVGWRTISVGLVLWLFISVASLACILFAPIRLV